jgi:hypothetical protein
MKTTNDIKIYDTEKVFELNPNMQIEISYISKNKLPLMIIDDFYKNPELVRELLINSPVPSITSSSNGGFPGKRVNLCSFMPQKFQHEYSDILRRYFKLDFHLEHAENAFLGNVFDASGSSDKFNNSTPHMDPAVIASIVYLNYDEEKVGGTSIYEHRASGLNFMPASRFHFEWISQRKAKLENRTISEVKEEFDKKFNQYRDEMFAKPSDSKEKRDTHILKSNNEWEILATVESKFNRLAGYIGGTLHSAMIDFDELSKKPYKRINQVIFMDQQRR